MRIVNIAGGLGNQMFQYAFALMLKQHYPDEQVMVDISHYNSLMFKRFGSINLHNGYEIEKVFPHATLPVAQPGDLRRVTRYIPNYVLSRLARRFLPRKSTEYVASYKENFTVMEDVFREGDTYYEGYWQSAGYYQSIKPLLRHTFAHPTPNAYNAALISQAESCDSVGIHVRRGDYKSAPDFNGICTTGYYAKAIAHLTADGRRRTFFVFSNDLAWCRANLPALTQGHEAVYVDGNRGSDSCWDMFLMTHCQELIIANSTFSWWGAFLNHGEGDICTPDPWLHRDCPIHIYDPQWVRIN